MASLWFTLRELTQVDFLSAHTHLRDGRLNIQPARVDYHPQSLQHTKQHNHLPSVGYPAILVIITPPPPTPILQNTSASKWKHAQRTQNSEREVFLLSESRRQGVKGATLCELCKYSIEWQAEAPHIPMRKKHCKSAKLPWQWMEDKAG